MSNAKFNIHSMTAFAKTQENSIAGRFSWEIRSVNQRYLEINPRLPDAFRHLENALRQQLKSALYRGKIDISLSFEKSNQQQSLQINQQILNPLVAAISEVQQALPEATQVNPLDILNWPGVLQTETLEGTQEQQEQVILESLDKAIELLQTQRQREGQALAQLILERTQKMLSLITSLLPRLTEIIDSQNAKLKARIQSVSEEFDEIRLHQEMAIMAQKFDVTEELDRLQTHLQEVENILVNNHAGKPTGRRLDFLMQELNREANTLGAKSVDSQLSQTSVELKVLIEQAREQVQNIE